MAKATKRTKGGSANGTNEKSPSLIAFFVAGTAAVVLVAGIILLIVHYSGGGALKADVGSGPGQTPGPPPGPTPGPTPVTTPVVVGTGPRAPSAGGAGGAKVPVGAAGAAGHFSVATGAAGPPVAQGTLAGLGWLPVESNTVKGCKATVVGTSIDPGSDQMYRGVLGARNTQATGNGNGGFESAFKVEDTTDPSKTVYYLSQFHTKPNDVTMPCAVSKPTRQKYREFYAKVSGTDEYEKFNKEGETLTGHECELLTHDSAKVTKPSEAEAECSKDPRCAGYYVATDQRGVLTDMKPVLASAVPGSCKVSWARVPATDRAKTSDLCNRYMGDGVWYTEPGNNKCFPTCPGGKGRTNTNLCYSEANNSKSSDKCMDGWILSKTSHAKYTCLPATEETCPIGWVLTDDATNYPNTGVCRPPCAKGKEGQSREDDGYCHYNNDKGWHCLPGTRHSYYTGNGTTDYCTPYAHDFNK